MHGIIHSELKRFVVARHGAGVWNELLKQAGLERAAYLASEQYPDDEASRIVATASRMTNLPAVAILEDFGEYIAPHLLEIYEPLIDPSWRTLDVIERTEGTIHSVVRLKDPAAHPPELKVRRIGPDEVELTYDSPRKMCSVAKGIGKGLGKHFGETIRITESSCMLQGAPSCVISFKAA